MEWPVQADDFLGWKPIFDFTDAMTFESASALLGTERSGAGLELPNRKICVDFQ